MAGSALGSIAGGVVSGIMGGGDAPSAPNIQTWIPPRLNDAATSWWTLYDSNSKLDPYKDYAKQFQDVYNTQYYNPYAGGAQTAANNAGAAYGQVGNQSLNAGQQVNGAALSMLPYAQQIMQTAMDPQNALYDRTLQQVQDQQRVAQAARGVTKSPYGAGLENQALSNFNIDWQNNQLQRQATGLEAANKAITGAAANTSTASNLGAAGAGALQQAGLLPYQTSQGIAGDQYNALSNIINSRLGSNQINSANMAALMQYMGLGAAQSNAQANWAQQNYMNQLNQAGTIGGGLGSLVNGAMGWWNSPSSTLPWLSNGSSFLNMIGL
jgi:hypothetical protein